MEFFQAFMIKTKACSQFYLENETQLSLRAKILTNSEFTCGQLHILSRAPSLNTSDTPVAAAQPGLKHGTQQYSTPFVLYIIERHKNIVTWLVGEKAQRIKQPYGLVVLCIMY